METDFSLEAGEIAPHSTYIFSTLNSKEVKINSISRSKPRDPSNRRRRIDEISYPVGLVMRRFHERELNTCLPNRFEPLVLCVRRVSERRIVRKLVDRHLFDDPAIAYQQGIGPSFEEREDGVSGLMGHCLTDGSRWIMVDTEGVLTGRSGHESGINDRYSLRQYIFHLHLLACVVYLSFILRCHGPTTRTASS